MKPYPGYDELIAACEKMLKCEPMQRGERNGAIMGMISLAIDAARDALIAAGKPISAKVCE